MLVLDDVFGRISEKGNGKARLKVSCGQSEDQPKRFAARTVAARSHTDPKVGSRGVGNTTHTTTVLAAGPSLNRYTITKGRLCERMN